MLSRASSQFQGFRLRAGEGGQVTQLLNELAFHNKWVFHKSGSCRSAVTICICVIRVIRGFGSQISWLRFYTALWSNKFYPVFCEDSGVFARAGPLQRDLLRIYCGWRHAVVAMLLQYR
jgi:hypothetical protein